jgi:crenactin
LGETPQVMQNRGYFPDKNSVIAQLMSSTSKEVVVGEEVPLYLESKEDLAQRLIYPMKNGIIEKNDERSWKVVKEITKLALNEFKPADPNFQGFYLVASLSSIAPRYMYENLFDIFKEIDGEEKLIKMATIISQPLAVAIAHKVPTCVVVESGHGNTQICPISRYPIKNAIVALNRGGGDANALMAEILKDLGYSDLASEEAVVRMIKEKIGLIPRDLDQAIKFSKENPELVRVNFKLPGTRLVVDFGKDSWVRFLLGEYVFDPNNEIFMSYFSRGMPRPKDVKAGDIYFYGMIDFGEAILQAVERCPIELQPHLYKQILLSGGNFEWNVPQELFGVAVDSKIKLKSLLNKHGIENVNITTSESPKFSVWRGSIIYGYAVPESYSWNWERMEGWLGLR